MKREGKCLYGIKSEALQRLKKKNYAKSGKRRVLSQLLLVFGRAKEVKLKSGVPPELQM